MKNKYIKIILIISLITGSLLSCNDTISLGERINLLGPIVEIHTPLARQPIDGKFLMTGSIEAMGNSTISRIDVIAKYNKETFPGSGEYIDSEYPVQWRYSQGSWKASSDYGKTWPIVLTGKWLGDNRSADWELPIDMTLFGYIPPESFYQFSVTAYDNGNNSDDNSHKTRTVSLHLTPPVVEIVIPEPFTDNPNDDNYKLFTNLKAVADTDINARRDVANMRYFISGSTDLKFQIDSLADVWSVDIRFYDDNETAGGQWYDKSEYDATGKLVLKDNYIYKTRFNPWEMPDVVPNPADILNPFYGITIPDLSLQDYVTGEVEIYIDQDKRYQQIKRTIDEKTTLRVVARCIDSAGNVIEEPYEVTQGFYIYWPKANLPWIEFPKALKDAYNPTDIYTIYPDSVMSARAFDNNGVERIHYSIWRVNDLNGELFDENPSNADYNAPFFTTDNIKYPDALHKAESELINSLINVSGTSVFSWAFKPPKSMSGYYYIEATAYDINPGNTKKHDSAYGYYVVKDLTYPEIDPPVTPDASEPLFKFIKGNPAGDISTWFIEISGFAYDNTEVTEVSMAWINPASSNYSAMSQLAFFRDINYGSGAITDWKHDPIKPPEAGNYGWALANGLGPNDPPRDDIGYDPKHPNLVWNMNPVATGKTVVRNSVEYNEYRYSKTIQLKTLNIGPGMMWADSDKTTMIPVPSNISKEVYDISKEEGIILDFLKSQVFVFKVTDDDDKSVTMSWAPQGDTFPPVVELKEVYIERMEDGIYVRKPGEFPLPEGGSNNEIPYFKTGDIIIITGEWIEDSSILGDEFTNSVIKDNLIVSINTKNVVTKTINSDGTWSATVKIDDESLDISERFTTGNLLDTLVVNVKLTDIGGNPSEDAASWLVESENLRITGVGSITSDGHYNAGKKIDIYLDFNKIVKWEGSGTAPALTLGNGVAASADYITDIPSNHNSPELPGVLCPACENKEGATRKYFRYTVGPDDNSEHLQVIGITGNSRFDAVLQNEYITISATATEKDEKLPVTTDSKDIDYPRTLMGSSKLIIDTIAPSNPAISMIPNPNSISYYKEGSVLWFYLTFTKDGNPDPIVINASNPPRLLLNIRKGNSSTGFASSSDTYATPNGTPTDTVMVNNNRLIFSYQIKKGDYTGDTANSISSLKIIGMDGAPITDMAGNAYTPEGDSGLTSSYPKIFNNFRADGVKPAAPSLKLITRDHAPSTPVLDVPNGNSTGSSDPSSLPAAKDIDVIFYDTLEMAITLPPQMPGKAFPNFYLEFSDKGGSTDTWAVFYNEVANALNQLVRTPYNDNTSVARILYIPVPNTMESTVTARIKDEAGNYSNWTNPLKFDWDNGVLFEHLTTTQSSGIKTNSSEKKDYIPIVLTFRHPVIITAVDFVLQVGDRTNPVTIYRRAFDPFNYTRPAGYSVDVISNGMASLSTPSRTWTFNYCIEETDTTGPNNIQKFAVKEMKNITATYTTPGSIVIPVGDMIELTDENNRIERDWSIYIQTGKPELEPGYPRLVNINYNADEDSFEADYEFRYNQAVSRGTDIRIEIIQKSAGYRIPAILNDTQRSRYYGSLNSYYEGSLTAGEQIFDRYYKRGIAGINSSGEKLTENKFILNFDNDTYNIAPGTADDISYFAEAFRQAEAVRLTINSTSITEMADGRGLIIRLTGANALKVIGAEYDVNFIQTGAGTPPSGAFVRNEIGNASDLPTGLTIRSESTNPPLKVAKPEIRVHRPQEIISTTTGSTTTAAITAVQPAQAQLRLDCRTPASRVVYIGRTPTPAAVGTSRDTLGNDTAMRWNSWYPTGAPTPTATLGEPASPATAINTALPTTPTSGPSFQPSGDTTQTLRYIYGSNTKTEVAPIRIGTQADTAGMFTGYRFRVRAAGVIGTGSGGQGATTSDFSSAHAQEIINRTVVIFQGVNQDGAFTAATFGNGAGYQLWLRGGNTPSSTTIPGFPLTTSDNWSLLSANKERAGIRLMSKTSGTSANNLHESRWQWVTWDVDVLAYFDVYIGYDTASSIDELYQYGPCNYARHLGEWAPLKQYYAAVPGERRWITNNNPTWSSQESYTFNSSFTTRSEMIPSIAMPASQYY